MHLVGVKTIGQLADLKHRNPAGLEARKLHGTPPDIRHLVGVAPGALQTRLMSQE
jgi:hypothetical protein